MAFKCAIQCTGLVRGEPTGKHRSNGKAIMGEMGKERISSSDTLNRALSSQNTYTGISDSGFAIWDDMESRANEYKQQVKGKDKKGNDVVRCRGLRKDAVIACAVIVNPPFEECKDWSRNQYDLFYADSLEIMAELKPEIFRQENEKFSAIHVDEGLKTVPPQIYDEHLHVAFDCIDKQGRYCGNEIDAKFLADLNKVYPAKMRERGWDMQDLDTTDWARYKTDTAYREFRKEKSKSSGKSVNKHIHQQAVNTLEHANEILVDVEQQKTEQTQIAISQENTRHRQEQLQQQLNDTAKSQQIMQDALVEQDRAYHKCISNFENEKKAYQTRYSTLYGGIQSILHKLPEAARSLLNEIIQGARAADRYDRYGINRIEDELETSKSAYLNAKKRLEIAIADERTQTRKKRIQTATGISKNISTPNDDYEQELEL